ncbi:MAG: TVP38/TMEM64 family protein [Chthoniobacteraceae bacterium]
MMPWLETYLRTLGSMGLTGAVLFFLSFAGLSLFGLPLVPFAVIGGLMFGVSGGLVGIIAGSTLGAALGFFFSRYVARDRVAKYLQKNPKFVMIDQAIRREGWKIIGLLRLCPIPFGVSNFAYGLTNVRFGHYLIATMAGMLPGEIVFVSLGSTGRQLSDVNHSPAAKAMTLVGVVALIGVLVLVKRMVTRRIQTVAEE